MHGLDELGSLGFDLPNPQRGAVVVTWDSSGNAAQTVALEKFSYKLVRTALRLNRHYAK